MKIRIAATNPYFYAVTLFVKTFLTFSQKVLSCESNAETRCSLLSIGILRSENRARQHVDGCLLGWTQWDFQNES